MVDLCLLQTNSSRYLKAPKVSSHERRDLIPLLTQLIVYRGTYSESLVASDHVTHLKWVWNIYLAGPMTARVISV